MGTIGLVYRFCLILFYHLMKQEQLLVNGIWFIMKNGGISNIKLIHQ